MAKKSRKAVKAAKKPAAKRAAKAAKPPKAARKKAVARKAARKSPAKSSARRPAKKTAAKKSKNPVLLSGGNPQIAKGYGDAPVKEYIAAMPGWKSNLGRRLDAIIERSVPGVRKAVKWNSPLYGVDRGDEKQTWFLGIHVFTQYVKVAFFRGASLDPHPPGESRQADVRYLDIREDDALDEAQFAVWVKQASELPGEKM